MTRARTVLIFVLLLAALLVATVFGYAWWVGHAQTKSREAAQALALERQHQDVESLARAQSTVIAHLSEKAVRQVFSQLDNTTLDINTASEPFRVEIHQLSTEFSEAFAGIWIEGTASRPQREQAVHIRALAELRFLSGASPDSMRISLHVVNVAPVFRFGPINVPIPEFLQEIAGSVLQARIDEALQKFTVDLKPSLPIKSSASDFGPIKNVKLGDNASISFDLQSGGIDKNIPLTFVAPIIDDRFLHLVLTVDPPLPGGPSLPQQSEILGAAQSPLNLEVPGKGDLAVSIHESAIRRVAEHIMSLTSDQRTVRIKSLNGGGRLVQGEAKFTARMRVPTGGCRSIRIGEYEPLQDRELGLVRVQFRGGGGFGSGPINPDAPDPRTRVPSMDPSRGPRLPGSVFDCPENIVRQTADALAMLLSTGSQLCPVAYDAHVSSDHNPALSATVSLVEVKPTSPWVARVSVAYKANAKVRAGARFRCLPGGMTTTSLDLHSETTLTVTGEILADPKGLSIGIVSPKKLKVPYTIDGADILTDKILGKWRWPDYDDEEEFDLPASMPILRFAPGCTELTPSTDGNGQENIPSLVLNWNVQDAMRVKDRLDIVVTGRVTKSKSCESAAFGRLPIQ